MRTVGRSRRLLAGAVALDTTRRVAFVAYDGNAALLTVDLGSGRVLGSDPVGEAPDVLAYDSTVQRLYVAAESGTLTVLTI